MQNLTNQEKLKEISEYLKTQKKVNSRYSLSKSQDPPTFIAQIQQGVDSFKRIFPNHVYDPGGFYVVELDYAYAIVLKRIKAKKRKEAPPKAD